MERSDVYNNKSCKLQINQHPIITSIASFIGIFDVQPEKCS